MSRILVAMSGGVDSSVVAYLLKEEGHEVVGVTMKLYENDLVGKKNSHTCCSLDDIDDARMVAYKLGIDYYVYDFSAEFEDKVVEKFVSAYEAGLTPNPCIDCNRHLKFSSLYDRAKELDCDYIATGHYAQIVFDSEKERYVLKKGLDDKKDQSYVLYSMTQEQLAHTLLPLGGMDKSKVRQIAEEAGLVNAKKHDSQDICFVPDGDYKAFLERYTNKTYEEGQILNKKGQVLGKHSGAVGYTIGQRKGLGLACGHPVYVTKKDMAKNQVTVGPEEELFSKGLYANDWTWVSIEEPQDKLQVMARTRYHQKETPGILSIEKDGRIKISFLEPKRAVTTGQAVVVYNGDTLLGGGTIIEIIEK